MSTHTSILYLEWRKRVGGAGRSERLFLDFVVDGHSLFDLITANGYDYIGIFGLGVREENIRCGKRLLLQERAGLANGRHVQYVCPECGDIGCGAITMRIEKNEGQYIWRDIGYEKDNEEGEPRYERMEYIGPNRYREEEYKQTIGGYISRSGV